MLHCPRGENITVTFCGHSDTPCYEEIRQRLHMVVKQLIEQGAERFYLGGYGNFDSTAASVVWSLKKQYSHIQSILVIPYLDKRIDASHYDDKIYPPLENIPRRYAIVHRNRWMVDNSDIVVAYVRHGWGGAAQMLEQAKRKGLTIVRVNVAETLPVEKIRNLLQKP